MYVLLFLLYTCAAADATRPVGWLPDAAVAASDCCCCCTACCCIRWCYVGGAPTTQMISRTSSISLSTTTDFIYSLHYLHCTSLPQILQIFWFGIKTFRNLTQLGQQSSNFNLNTPLRSASHFVSVATQIFHMSIFITFLRSRTCLFKLLTSFRAFGSHIFGIILQHIDKFSMNHNKIQKLSKVVH